MNLSKNEQFKILQFVLFYDDLLLGCKSHLCYSTSLDDHERYCKMAMKIDSSDPIVLDRNQNNNDFTNVEAS